MSYNTKVSIVISIVELPVNVAALITKTLLMCETPSIKSSNPISYHLLKLEVMDSVWHFAIVVDGNYDMFH